MTLEELSSYSYPKSSSSSKIKSRPSSKSSSLHLSSNHEEDVSYHLTKEILGPTKILDLSDYKNILEKTSGTNKNL